MLREDDSAFLVSSERGTFPNLESIKELLSVIDIDVMGDSLYWFNDDTIRPNGTPIITDLSNPPEGFFIAILEPDTYATCLLGMTF